MLLDGSVQQPRVMFMFRPSLIFFALLSIIQTSIASAATYKYSYTGNEFFGITDSANVAGSYSDAMKVTGYIVLDSALPANMNSGGPYNNNLFPLFPGQNGVLDYSFSDGRQTIDASTAKVPGPYTFAFKTDGSGEIIGWVIALFSASTWDGVDNIIGSNFDSDGYAVTTDGGRFAACGFGCGADTARVDDNPGSWHLTVDGTVPVPATLPMMSAAIFAFVSLRLRKKLNANK